MTPCSVLLRDSPLTLSLAILLGEEVVGVPLTAAVHEAGAGVPSGAEGPPLEGGPAGSGHPYIVASTPQFPVLCFSPEGWRQSSG